MENLQRMSLTNENEIKVQIRWMVYSDIPNVHAIERECFEYAWSEDDFMQCYWQRNCTGMVAEYSGKVIGYMFFEKTKSRIHLLNVATCPKYRHLGVGTQMVARLIGKLCNHRRRIILEVRETNLAAQLFFRSLGFKATDILKEFYEEMPEDAYQMVYRFKQESVILSEPIQSISLASV